MADIISISPLYIPLTQKPNCCAPACLQMILYRNGFGLFDQEDLAIKLGVKIPPALAVAFKNEMQIMTRQNHDEGTQTVEAENLINEALSERAPNLWAKSIKASSIGSLGNFISTHLRQNHDLWVEYHIQETHGANFIHDGLIESFDPIKNEVVIIDPDPRNRQRLAVSLETLERAMSSQFGRETGFIIVENQQAASPNHHPDHPPFASQRIS